MKLLLFYRTVFLVVFATIPVALTAADGGAVGKPFRRELVESTLPVFQDSTGGKRKPEKKPQDEPVRPSGDARQERLKEARGRAIKQVPRSVPKLKPQPVSAGVKIKTRQ